MAISVSDLTINAFSQLVLEERLPTWEAEGYTYTGKRGSNGWELYRCPGPHSHWVYQARRVCTQNNAGGGALTVRISIPSGMVARLAAMYAQGPASAGSTFGIYQRDEDGARGQIWATVGAGASRTFNLPSIGTTAGHENTVHTMHQLIAPGTIITIESSAAAQTETLTVYVVFEVWFDVVEGRTTPTEPTWDTTGSAGTPALAASTISTANTWQRVYGP